MAVRWRGRRERGKGEETGSPQADGDRWYGERARAYAHAVRRRVHEAELGPA